MRLCIVSPHLDDAVLSCGVAMQRAVAAGGDVVVVNIFSAGTGSPYFSTDTTAALRASEIGADVILMAKNGVDGVYDADPKVNPNAKRYDHLTYREVITRNLQIMDHTAITMCADNNIDLIVFNMNQNGNIKKAVIDRNIGTIISKEEN